MPARERKTPQSDAPRESRTNVDESSTSESLEYDPNTPDAARSPQHDSVFGDSGTGQLDADTALRNAQENSSS